jgi:hypothetical protein
MVFWSEDFAVAGHPYLRDAQDVNVTMTPRIIMIFNTLFFMIEILFRVKRINLPDNCIEQSTNII